jgi:hypothetical protein
VKKRDLQWACATVAVSRKALRICMVSVGSCSTIETGVLVLPSAFYNRDQRI